MAWVQKTDDAIVVHFRPLHVDTEEARERFFTSVWLVNFRLQPCTCTVAVVEDRE